MRRLGRISVGLLLSLVANVVLAAGLGYLLTQPARPEGEVGSVRTGPVAGAVSALGRVRPAGGVVNITGVPGDRIASVKVKLGQPVAAGTVLLTLAGETERQLALSTLDAQLQEAEAVRAAAQKARDARLAALEAELIQANAKLAAELAALDARAAVADIQRDQARTELARLDRARSAGVNVPDQEVVSTRALAARAEAESAAVAVQKTKATEQRAAAEAGAEASRLVALAEADRALAQVPTESLKAARAAAEYKLTAAQVVAPVAGRVVRLAANPGDTVGPTPLVEIADTDRLVVVAEVYETDIVRLRGWLKPGVELPVTIEARVLGETAPLTGVTTAAQLAPMIARNQVFAVGPREDTDRRVVEVEVTLSAAAVATLRDYLGLQVRVEIPPPAAAP